MTHTTTNELLRKALLACLPYMEGLESDNDHDPSVGIYADHELTDALHLATTAIKAANNDKENERRTFAAMALQGIMANQKLLVNLDEIDGGVAGHAVRHADALILELLK